MKTIFTIFTALLTACFLNLSAQTIYVDASNNTGIEDGTEQHPFNTIKEGIASSITGTTVMIKSGSYYPDENWSDNDSVLLLKAGIKLKGEGRTNTLIEGFIFDLDMSNSACSLEDMSFYEYHFVRGTEEGPFGDTNTIRKCGTKLISISHGAAIPQNDTTPGPNFAFLIEQNDLGINGSIQFIQGSGQANNTVKNNICGSVLIFSGAGYTYKIDDNNIQHGIKDVSGVCNTTISNNRIYNGPIIDKSGGNPYGIEEQFIENNEISCNADAPMLEDEENKASILANSRSVTIRNNTITCNGNVSGIYSNVGSPFHVINNTIYLDEVIQPTPNPDEAVCGIYSKSGWGYVTGNVIQGGQIGYYSQAGTEIFADNEINNAYYGFYSVGAEEVHHNLIEDCHDAGMILNGLRGPIHHNTIRNNGGHGIWVLRPQIDLGGGEDNCPGANVIQGNGDFDLYIETENPDTVILFARNNVWDHTDPEEIALYDIRDGNDSAGLVTIVDFTPIGYANVDDYSPDLGFIVYPNPTTSVFSLQSLIFSQKSVTVEILDLNGRKLIEKYIPVGTETIEIDMGHLKCGVYFCRLISKDKSATRKIIKQ